MLLGVALLLVLHGPSRPAAAASCESLTSLALPDTTITAAAVDGTGTRCQVTGVVAPANDFAVWLPTTGWNQKLMSFGNGGLGGYINVFGMLVGIRRGYAVAGTTGGHVGGPSDGSWALGHPERVEDFGHRGIHVVTAVAKAIVAAFYEVPPQRSYFAGCSTGGRQALIEAQRYPEDYDGIISGAPANFFTHLSAASNWVSQAVHEDPASIIPLEFLPVLERAVLDRCDRVDGLRDGLIDDPRRCRFEPALLRCRGATTGDCLGAAQVRGLKKLYAGPHTPSGKPIFPGFVPGGEMGRSSDPGPVGEPSLGAWEVWLVGDTPGVHHQIQDGFFKYLVFEDPSWDWRSFDFGRDLRTTDAKLASVLNATDPNLDAFRARGGKLLMFHGWSDPAISPLNTIAYYDSVVRRQRRGRSPARAARDTNDFLRLFMAPGMQHCAGGPGLNTFDIIGPLEQWVEHGVAPEQIVARHTGEGGPERTRPLCPYPQVARHDGTGSIDDATSFTCRPPHSNRR